LIPDVISISFLINGDPTIVEA